MKTRNKSLIINIDMVIDVLFVIMLTVNSTLEMDPKLYIIPKIIMAVFFLAMMALTIISRELVLGVGLIFPVLFFFFETLSVFWSQSVKYSISQWNTQAQLFVLFLFVYYYTLTRRSLKTFLCASYISGYALLFYTVFKYGIKGIVTIMISADRLGGEINNENAYGMVFSFAVLVAFYWITEGKTKWHILSMVLFSFFALASGSKKAAIMIVVGILAISLLTYGIKKIWKTLLVIALLFVAFFFVTNSGLFGSTVKRLSSFLSGQLELSDQRRQMYREAGLKLIFNKPLFGYGLASFAKVTDFGTYAHDNFVEIGVGTGIIGILLYYISWLTAAVLLFKNNFKKKNDCFVLFIFVAIEIIMGFGMVQYDVRSSWILLAVSLAMIDKPESNDNSVAYREKAIC